MVKRFYSWKRARSTQRLSLLLIAAIGACGGAPSKPSRGPSDAVAIEIDKAEAQEQQREYLKAREHYERAIALAKDADSLAFAQREFASALVFWGEYAEATRALKSSLEADSEQVQVWHDLGILQARAGEQVQALQSLERAVSLAPKEPRTRIALAALLVQMRRFSAAQAQYQELLTLKIPDSIRRATLRALEILRAESELGQEEPAKAVPQAP